MDDSPSQQTEQPLCHMYYVRSEAASCFVSLFDQVVMPDGRGSDETRAAILGLTLNYTDAVLFHRPKVQNESRINSSMMSLAWLAPPPFSMLCSVHLLPFVERVEKCGL